MRFLTGDGYRYKALRDLFYLYIGLFVIIVGGLVKGIYKSIKKKP